MTTWRYQPVYTEDPDGARTYSLCEVYLDDAGKLEMWTEEKRMTPTGETAQDLIGDLIMMLSDAHKWEPVRFDDMEPGMQLERAGPERAGRVWIEGEQE